MGFQNSADDVDLLGRPGAGARQRRMARRHGRRAHPAQRAKSSRDAAADRRRLLRHRRRRQLLLRIDRAAGSPIGAKITPPCAE